MIQFDLVSPLLDFPQTSPELIANWYPENVGNKKWILRTTPGLKLLGMMQGTGGVRGLLQVLSGGDEFLFGIRGSSFQKWDPVANAWVFLGTIGSTTGNVAMDYNGPSAGNYQVGIADASGGWGYDPSLTPAFKAIPSFPGGAATMTYYGLRFYSVAKNTGMAWCSAKDDVFTWSGLAFAEAETRPDPLVGIANVGQFVILMGSQSYEAWINQGLLDFPLQRIQAGTPIGCSAPASMATYAGSLYWIGGSQEGHGTIFQTFGYSYRRISDHRIEEMLSAMTDFSDAIGFCYQEDGHVFYELSFPTGNKTLVYDTNTGLWAQRFTRNSSTDIESYHPAVFHAFYKGKNYVGDFRDGSVYEYSRSYFMDNGNPIIRRKVFPNYPDDSYQLTPMGPFFLAMEMGNINQGDQTPKAMLSWSENRGKTYGIQHYKDLATTGDYSHRLVWHGQGATFGRAYKLELTGNCDFIIRAAGLL